MTEDDVVVMLHRYFEQLFPKVCSCGRVYPTLRSYIESTTPTGPAMSYDAELGEWETTQPIGSVVVSNCACGSSLSLSTDQMALADRLEVLRWLKGEYDRRGGRIAPLLAELRERIRRRALNGE